MKKTAIASLAIASTLCSMLMLGCSPQSSEEPVDSNSTQEASTTSSQESPEQQNAETDGKASSQYSVSWVGEAPTVVGGAESEAIIKDAFITQASSGNYILCMNFEYTNNSENAMNFINDYHCYITPFQNGIELDRPSTISEKGVFDTNESYTSIKKGATLETQLAWILQDTTNPIEIEFGHNELNEPQFIATLEIKQS